MVFAKKLFCEKCKKGKGCIYMQHIKLLNYA